MLMSILLIISIIFNVVVDSELNESDSCISDDFRCVPYYQCINGFVNTNGKYLMDHRFIRTFTSESNPPIDNEKHGTCKSWLQTCCQKPQEIKSLISENNLANANTSEGDFDSNTCGFTNPNGLNINQDQQNISEKYAKFGEYPWTVGILEIVKDTNLHRINNVLRCGGSLIRLNIVLTLASCVYQSNTADLIIYAGEWNINLHNSKYPVEQRLITSYKIHPDYNMDEGFINDLAIVYLQKPLEETEHIKTICLPPPMSNFDNEKCVAVGWGKDKFGKAGVYSNILKRIDGLQIIDRQQCEMKLKQTRLGDDFQLDKSYICAGGEPDKDTCKGDGGSPLICPVHGINDKYYQVGIVAWGIGCYEATPGVYVNVPLFRNWIDAEIKNH